MSSTASAATAPRDFAPSFLELGVPIPLVNAIAATGITDPFPIQTATIPDALAGRDVLGRGRTGSGKTIAFAVPVIAGLAANPRRSAPKRPRALILVPTRELAAQVAKIIRPLASAMGLRSTTVFGGVSQVPQVDALRKGVDIVVATPGRLEDLIAQGNCRLDEVLVTVLDEADHMADLGFLPAVKRILDQTPRNSQRLLFSATLDHAVDSLVRKYLNKPVTHEVDGADSPPEFLEHHLFQVNTAQKSAVVTELASGEGRSLLFTRTKHGARKLAKQLTAAGIPAVDLHGNLSQNVRQHNLAAFANGSARVLVATDIAARGIHVDDIALVVHVDPPAEHKAYLHRSGRTARAGAAGVVVTVMTPDQHSHVRSLFRDASVTPAKSNVVPGDPQTVALTGPPAARRHVAVEVVAAPAPASNGRSAQRRPVSSARGPRAAGNERPNRPSRPSRPRTRAGQNRRGSSSR